MALQCCRNARDEVDEAAARLFERTVVQQNLVEILGPDAGTERWRRARCASGSSRPRCASLAASTSGDACTAMTRFSGKRCRSVPTTPREQLAMTVRPLAISAAAEEGMP